MPDPATQTRLRGLILNASDIKSLTDWPEAMVEDYLNILDNLILVSDILDEEIDSRIIGTFVDGDLVAGTLTIVHDLDQKYVSVTIFDNTDEEVNYDSHTPTDTTTTTVDLSSFGALTGTWTYRVDK